MIKCQLQNKIPLWSTVIDQGSRQNLFKLCDQNNKKKTNKPKCYREAAAPFILACLYEQMYKMKWPFFKKRNPLSFLNAEAAQDKKTIKHIRARGN